MAPPDYTSLQTPALRKDWDRNNPHTNKVELLECGYKRLPDILMEVGLETANLLAPFSRVELDNPPDPDKGWGLQLIGYTLPYKDNKLKVGDHLIARVHAEIPQIKLTTFKYHVVRNTYTVDERKWEDMDPNRVDEFYEKQLKQFGKSFISWFRFLSYLLFTQLEKGDNNTSLPTFDDDYKDYHFEDYKKSIFDPTNASTNGYPFSDVHLSLEKTWVIDKTGKATENIIKTDILAMRKKLVTNKVEYDPTKPRFNHDIPEEAFKTLALRDKIIEVAGDMLGNRIKYRLSEKTKGEGFAINVKQNDLICFLSPKNQDALDAAIPSLILPKSYKFDAAGLRVGQVIETRCFSPGTALVIHRDALKLIITRNKYGTAVYNEHEKVNHWMSIGYYFDLFDLFPCAFIKAK